MRAGKVVERALRHHTHGAACGVSGLCHRVERAVAADGDQGRAGRYGPCRSLLRYAGQLGGAAEEQVTSPSTSPQRGLDDFALRLRIAAARCRIDDELQR